MDSSASGPAALSMVHYMCDYTAKAQLDTSVVFGAMCASLRSLHEQPPPNRPDGASDETERARQLIVKATNKLVGKREMSGQQTASYLLGRKNRYTSDEYQQYWWSSTLRALDRSLFMSSSSENETHEGDRDGAADGHEDHHEDEHHYIPLDEDDTMIFLTAERVYKATEHDYSQDSEQPGGARRYPTLFEDIFYRPTELQNMCAWDMMRQYVKEKIPMSKKQRLTYLRFQPGHPHYTTHCLKKLQVPVIPVLMGYRVPRNDLESDVEKYACTMMMLFKPWFTADKRAPLKPRDMSWTDAFREFQADLPAEHSCILRNMQLLYQTHDAKFDFAAKRSKRLGELRLLARKFGIDPDAEVDDTGDPMWENAMQVECNVEDENDMLELNTPANCDAYEIANVAKKHGFYSMLLRVNEEVAGTYRNRVKLSDEYDESHASLERTRLLKEKDAVMKARRRKLEQAQLSDVRHRHQHSNIPDALSTTLEKEACKAKELYEKFHRNKNAAQDIPTWHSLHPYQQLCISLVIKHTLNEEQTRAFLLLADAVGRMHEDGTKNAHMTMLVTGPGGTGKSAIFQAWREFYDILGCPERLRLTAPTGVVASDIGGGTIHSEASLRTSQSRMKSSAKTRADLEERMAPVETLILDEVYFLSATDLSLLSEYLCLAKGSSDEICGGLNWAVCGDPCQLPPPQGKKLFDRALVKSYMNDSLNDLNETVRQQVKGIQVWHQVKHVVVLDEIMRQKDDPVLIDILKRLRKGLCNKSDKDILDKHVLSNPDCDDSIRQLTNIERWIYDPTNACPLIVYTNVARDEHNKEMSKAFAVATGQESHTYYARDMMVGTKGTKPVQLRGQAAQAAWASPVKKAGDLGGKVPYVPGMPVLCTKNIATELGISNGTMGTLISITYEEFEGRRYAVSAEVEFNSYTNSDPNARYPHRVTLKPVSNPFNYRLPGYKTPHRATRWQLPLIPAFSFTSHNAQGRSLNACCIDLTSCPNIQSAYVMLSRVRSLKGLCILRPFDISCIQKHISEELRAELERTERRAGVTKLYSREHLSWFYNIVPEGHVGHLHDGRLRVEEVGMDVDTG